MQEGDVYRIQAHYGLPREAVQYALLQPLRPGRSSVTGRVALEGRPIHIPDVQTDPEYDVADFQQVFQYRTILGVPLLRDGRRSASLRSNAMRCAHFRISKKSWSPPSPTRR
jgi:GAF domain-containing protein